MEHRAVRGLVVAAAGLALCAVGCAEQEPARPDPTAGSATPSDAPLQAAPKEIASWNGIRVQLVPAENADLPEEIPPYPGAPLWTIEDERRGVLPTIGTAAQVWVWPTSDSTEAIREWAEEALPGWNSIGLGHVTSLSLMLNSPDLPELGIEVLDDDRLDRRYVVAVRVTNADGLQIVTSCTPPILVKPTESEPYGGPAIPDSEELEIVWGHNVLGCPAELCGEARVWETDRPLGDVLEWMERTYSDRQVAEIGTPYGVYRRELIPAGTPPDMRASPIVGVLGDDEDDHRHIYVIECPGIERSRQFVAMAMPHLLVPLSDPPPELSTTPPPSSAGWYELRTGWEVHMWPARRRLWTVAAPTTAMDHQLTEWAEAEGIALAFDSTDDPFNRTAPFATVIEEPRTVVLTMPIGLDAAVADLAEERRSLDVDSVEEGAGWFRSDTGRWPTSSGELFLDPGLPGWIGPYTRQHRRDPYTGEDYQLENGKVVGPAKPHSGEGDGAAHGAQV